MKRYIAYALALLFYASILPWHIPSADAAPKARFSDLTVESVATIDNVVIDNSLIVGASGSVVRDLRWSATASVADNAAVTHGLGATPTAVIASPSLDNEVVSVTAIGATTFTVRIRKTDGSAGTTQTIYWIALR